MKRNYFLHEMAQTFPQTLLYFRLYQKKCLDIDTNNKRTCLYKNGNVAVGFNFVLSFIAIEKVFLFLKIQTKALKTACFLY